MAEEIPIEIILDDGRLLERRFMDIDKAELRILETNDKKIKEIEELKEYIKEKRRGWDGKRKFFNNSIRKYK